MTMRLSTTIERLCVRADSERSPAARAEERADHLALLVAEPLLEVQLDALLVGVGRAPFICEANCGSSCAL